MRVGSFPLLTERSPAGDALPEGRVESGVNVALKFPPVRIKSLVLLRGHARVLGGVHAAAVFKGDLREAVEKIEADAGTDGKIERQHDAGLGEGHHADRWHVTEK